MTWFLIFLAFIIGGMAGVLAMSLCFMAKDADER